MLRACRAAAARAVAVPPRRALHHGIRAVGADSRRSAALLAAGGVATAAAAAFLATGSERRVPVCEKATPPVPDTPRYTRDEAAGQLKKLVAAARQQAAARGVPSPPLHIASVGGPATTSISFDVPADCDFLKVRAPRRPTPSDACTASTLVSLRPLTTLTHC